MVSSPIGTMSVSAKSEMRECSARSNPRVLVSVLSYNSPEDAAETVRCLQRQTYPNFTLQVVDNASTNKCAEKIVTAFRDLDIKVLPENLGYTGGNNLVLRQALAEGYDHVLLCNHDIEVDKCAVAWLVETAQAHRDADVIGGVEISFSTGKRRASGGGAYRSWISRTAWLTLRATSSDPSVKVWCVHGALILFTRRALESGLLMDENLFMYMDEIDIGFQLREKGLRAYTDQRVLFKHKSEPYQFNEYTGYLMQRNRLYIVKKYGAWYHQFFYHVYSLFFELPAKVCLRVIQGHSRFAAACVMGHIDGLLGRMGRDRVHSFLSSHST